jgi:hypothetical protein
MLVGVSQQAIFESIEFLQGLHIINDRKTGAVSERSLVKTVLWMTSRVLGTALFIASFGWFGYSWIVADIPFVISLLDGIVLYVAAMLCYAFPKMWTYASSTFFMISAAWSGKKLAADTRDPASPFFPHMASIDEAFNGSPEVAV